ELSLGNRGLVKPGDLAAWMNALEVFLATKRSPTDFDRNAIPTIQHMTQEVLKVYRTAIES
ncbi:MAG: hypothetical protein OER59_06770, partial [Desulfobulbaceae bacterium]|nr:hypothetical protein [Desulfobulbaceae bacterium]